VVLRARGLHESGAIEATIAELTERGETYEADGALFLRTTDHGDDKDRVLVRSDGRPTYFAADCAYLRDKWGAPRGALIYLLGADHHGYVDRLKAAAACLGIPPTGSRSASGSSSTCCATASRCGCPSAPGRPSTSTRSRRGRRRRHPLPLPAPGARHHGRLRPRGRGQQSMENPVYYVQYAHARIARCCARPTSAASTTGRSTTPTCRCSTHPAELELLTAMAQLPLVVAEAAELRATQRLARYAEELAGTFHRFYTECRILAPEDPDRRRGAGRGSTRSAGPATTSPSPPSRCSPTRSACCACPPRNGCDDARTLAR
jgi:arginyl-tRNA synthetase